ncbi:uncharacterized protein BXZ73DRAFT_78271 [Epithele typhae]|uniref:uncharacterized protein n=1 Tax=Epithele typhae TaxID=378194 RepID=UPI002007644B|nr:uncharacterized protein BXZ73DRAFT_78271 [Epithele typhae]KAH9928445.1 hypothetical protein BXZ73DRAFT_78271 [Epithele typhae]
MSPLEVHTPRVRNLTIYCGWQVPVLELDVDFPQLESLTLYSFIYFSRSDEAAHEPVPIFSFAASPMLRKLTLKAFHFFPGIAYGSLTHLALEDMTLPSLGSVLRLISRCAPTLEGLVLRELSVRARPPTPAEEPPQIHLPRVRRLALGSRSVTYDSIQFLKYLIPPASASLHLVGDVATNLPPSLPALAWIGACTTLAVALADREVTLVLSGAPGPHAAATLSLGWKEDRDDPRSAPRAKLLAHVPWARLAAVALRADTLDCSPFVLLDVVRSAAPERVRSLRVALAPSLSLRHGREVGEVLSTVVGGPGKETPGLDELEVWTEDVKNQLVPMELGRRARGVKKVVVHCPALKDETLRTWWDQTRRDLPQAEMRLLGGQAMEALHLPELDKAMDGFVWS